MLVLDHVSKNFDAFTAVSDLYLEIPKGELFCFLGPNGAGKTTTIKMITGMLRPSTGRILIDGLDNQKNPVEAKRRVGFIPDTPYLYEKLSGREFMQFVGNLFHVSAERQRVATDKYFEIFGLTGAADQLIENYSHGMRQKLCFSAAFMHEPSLLVIDEPMVGLDPRSMRTLKNLLRDYCREGGTIFLSTHLLPVAEELGDRLGIITHSKVRFLGTTASLRATMAREGSLEDLFLELTEDGCTADLTSIAAPREETA